MARDRLRFGPNKYAALHLLLCRWLRYYSRPGEYRYITMGGTELVDLLSLAFVDPQLMSDALSYECDGDRHALALESCDRLKESGVTVTVKKGNFFSYRREDDRPHLFFIDLEGVFAWADYHVQTGRMLQEGCIREGDALVITSHLGHNPGWPRVFSTFDGEFRLLGVGETEQKREWYRRAHPAFTLYKALQYAGLVDDIELRTFGCIEYRDTSPMGLYGFVVGAGRTHFATLVRAEDAPYYRSCTCELFLGRQSGA